MLEYNNELKKYKEIHRQNELKVIEKCNQEEEQKNHRKEILKQLETNKFNKMQETRNKLIEVATNNLLLKMNNDEQILLKQQEELLEKENRKFEEKKRKQEECIKLINQSRVEQINKKNEELEQFYKEEEERRLMYERKSKIEEEKEIQKENIRYDKVKELKGEYLEQMNVKKLNNSLKKSQKKDELALLNTLNDNDKKFVNIVKKEIENNIVNGKPVYTLFKALEYQQPVLIPSILRPEKSLVKGAKKET